MKRMPVARAMILVMVMVGALLAAGPPAGADRPDGLGDLAGRWVGIDTDDSVWRATFAASGRLNSIDSETGPCGDRSRVWGDVEAVAENEFVVSSLSVRCLAGPLKGTTFTGFGEFGLAFDPVAGTATLDYPEPFRDVIFCRRRCNPHDLVLPGVGGDGVLTIGTIFPVTGFLESFGPAEVYGAELAVQDINDAGGVFGTNVALEQGDSGDTTTDLANQEVDRLLSQGADAIMGAASSAVSLTVIDKITGAGVIQFSPANTSPIFTTYDDGGLYFRTAPSDLLWGRVLADVVTGQGNNSASVLFRDDSYGQGQANAFSESFDSLGGTIDEFVSYAIDATNFDAEVDQLVAAGSDAVIVIGFLNDSGDILTAMHDRGIGPTSATNVWGTDANTNLDAVVADASILEGMGNTVAAVDPASIPDFITRLEAAMPPGATTAYGANTYDAVIIVALAAEVAGADNGVAIAAEINDVTKGGESCTTFAACKAIVAAGGDPDYDGLGGPYEFFEAGEPSIASFRLETYGADGRDETLDVYVFAT